MPSALPETLLTIEEVCRTLAISSATVFRYVKAGTLPAPTKIGSATRWKRSSTDAVIAKADAAARAA